MSRTMEFGVFEEFARRGAAESEADSFARSFEVIDEAERGGIDAVWLAEIHFAPDRSVLAAPMAIAAGIAGRTERIKIGTAVQILPLVNPLRIAEDAATVDQISHGRLIFGVGRSGFPRSYLAYGVSYAESKERFNEALEIIRLAWTQPSFSYEGKYHHYQDVRFSPQPYQKPLPPIRVAATSPDTFPAIGAEGYPIFVGVRQGSFSELLPHIEAYRAAYQAAGHPGKGQVYVRVPLYVADSDERGVSEPEESIMHFMRRQARQQAESAVMPGVSDIERRMRNSEALENYTYEDVRRDKVVVGTPETVTKRLKQIQEELGLDGILAELNSGGLISQDGVLHSLRLLCSEVLPCFN
jgi:alkanesulfonate monooxygenase SsuD/methylene tetrahydromethanopterin reductase-like flavin-dependent oxidoreductase (luciferase family)